METRHGVMRDAFLKGHGVLKMKMKKKVGELSPETVASAERLLQDVLVARVLRCKVLNFSCKCHTRQCQCFRGRVRPIHKSIYASNDDDDNGGTQDIAEPVNELHQLSDKVMARYRAAFPWFDHDETTGRAC